jgi:hypothetical protein
MGDMQRTPVSVGSGDPVVGGQDRAGRDPLRQSQPGQRRRTEIIGLPAHRRAAGHPLRPGRARHRLHLAHHAGRMAQRQVMSAA